MCREWFDVVDDAGLLMTQAYASVGDRDVGVSCVT